MTEPLTGVLVDAAVALPHLRVPARSGTVAHARWDEDVVTLGARAALEVLDRTATRPRVLLIATVSSPFAEGGVAQVLAEVLGLSGHDLLVQEHGGSVAATGGALASALAFSAGHRGPVLLVAADIRRDARGRALGDAAVALLIDQEGDGARIEHLGSAAVLLRDHWRLDGDVAVTAAERSLLKVMGVVSDDILVAATPEAPRIERVGAAGCASFPLAMLLALAGGRSGEATTTAGGVSHRFTVNPGAAAEAIAERVSAAVASGTTGPAPKVPVVEGFDPYSSQPRLHRDRGQDLRLEGQRDPQTGEVLFPPVPSASAAGLEPHRLSRHGTVLTTTRDHIFPQDAPLSMAVVDLDGGGRFFGQVADGLEVTIGQRVQLVLRRLHDGGGLPHWFYKVVPDPDEVVSRAATA